MLFSLGSIRSPKPPERLTKLTVAPGLLSPDLLPSSPAGRAYSPGPLGMRGRAMSKTRQGEGDVYDEKETKIL